MRTGLRTTDGRITHSACLLAVLITVATSAAIRGQEPSLQPRSVLGGRLSLLMPAEFTPMAEEVMRRKYPSSYRPGNVYTNAATTINVAFDHTSHQVTGAQLGAAYESMRTAMKNMYPSAVWFRSELRKINGREFFLMEMRTPALDTEVRNIIVGTSVDDRLLMVTFNCMKSLEQQWVPVGNKIIESIAVK
jgi:hypothetical protein